MKKLLMSLLILVFSSYAFAADKVVHEGEPGIFIPEKDGKAEEALARIKEYPHLKKQIDLYENLDESQDKLTDLKEKQLEIERKISESWKKAFETAQKEVAKREAQDDFRLYIYVGLFAGGTIVGAAMMYGSSVVLHNIR